MNRLQGARGSSALCSSYSRKPRNIAVRPRQSRDICVRAYADDSCQQDDGPSTSGRSHLSISSQGSMFPVISRRSSAASSASMYGPKALHTRESRTLLEAELFGPEPELPAAQAELKRLTARVRTASRWSEVRAVLEAVQLQGVTTQHIVNITAPHFGSPAAPQPPLRAGVTGTARSSSGDGSTPKIDAILISALFSHLPRLLRAGWGASGSAGGGHAAGGGVRMSESDRQEMAKAVDSLVRCHLVPMLKQPGALDAQALVNAAVGLAKMGWGEDFGSASERERQAVFAAITDASVPCMRQGRMTPQGLSTMFWALATVGFTPPGSWLSVLWAELEGGLEDLNAQDVANVWWATCKLELLPPWIASSGNGASLPGMLPHALSVVGEAGRSSGQDPSTVLVCLAIWARRYSWRPDEEAVQGLLRELQPNLGAYLPQDLVSIVHSLVVLNISPTRSWMSSFYIVLKDRLIFDPTLSYSDFQRLLWALSRIDYTPPQSWLRSFVEISRVKLRHLRYRALAELLWAMSCWGQLPTAEWLQEYFNVTLAKLPDYKPNHLANSILALKRMGCKVPTVWLDSALRSFCAQLDDSKAHDIITFLDGIVDVAEDAAWMAHPETGKRLRQLADFSASKFEIYDALMHVKLLVALATARCCPSPGWLARQQETLARALAGDESDVLDAETAAQVRSAYVALQAPLSPALASELDARSASPPPAS